jgi:adenosylcobyric acid synthase
MGVAARRTAMLDRLADAADEHLDTAAILRFIEHGPPAGLRHVPPR